jgi:hypothetical protein
MGAHERYVQEAIGPRRVGGVYRSAYWGVTYQVERILLGQDARKVIAWSDWAVVEVDLDGPTAGQRHTHCTPWDDRDRIVGDR